MANVDMFLNENVRPTHRKENKNIILEKIAVDVEKHRAKQEKVKKEAEKALVLLYPNGKEKLSVIEKYDNLISLLEKDIELLTSTYKKDHIKTTMPLYLYQKSLDDLKTNYEKTLEDINNDISKKERSLNAQTVNRPQREFNVELNELVKKHNLNSKSIKKSNDLGKIAIAEELEYLEDLHKEAVEELTLKYQDKILEADRGLLSKDDIKIDLEALQVEKAERLNLAKLNYESELGLVLKPDKASIDIDAKELKRGYIENKKALEIEKKALLKEKKEALSQVLEVEVTEEEKALIKQKSKQIKKEAKTKTLKIKQDIKKIQGYRPRKLTYNRRKVLFGLVFLAPWIVGFIILFAVPFVQSLYYSFFELTPSPGEIGLKFIGIDNYIYAFQEHVYGTDSSFKIEILNTLQESVINLFVLVVFSLFIAVLLNHEFRGRAIIRAIFFIPVILNSSAVSVALSQGGGLTELLLEESAVSIFNLGDYLAGMGIGTTLVGFVSGLIGRIYDIITLSGVPILLFLAAIQSVPKHLYEAATIEGATGYEQFWLITLPNVSSHIITVSIYAIVDTFLTSSVSTIITYEFNQQNWGLSSAMSWVYVGLIIGILLVLAIFAKIFNIGASHYEKE